MSIRTSNNSKQQVLSVRSPVRTLLESMLEAAMDWIARKIDKRTGNRIGKVTQVEDIVKWDKDTFSLYGRCGDKTLSINDIRGKSVFLLRQPDGRLFMADYFLFCLGAGKYILTDWMTVWHVMDKLTRGTTIFSDAWRMNRRDFVALLQKEISDKIKTDRGRT